MNNTYKQLFKLPGAVGFSVAAFFGRLPAGMIGLAIILPLSKLTGSYMIAGIVAASTMIGMALCAPFSGQLVDKYGQCKILFILAVINFIGTSALIACIQYRASLEILCIAGFIAGASRISTGILARTRWVYVTRTFNSTPQERMLQSAYAFESIVDELVFISAPIIATLLCAYVHPLAGLVSCLIFYVVGAVALAMQHSTQPNVVSRHTKQSSALSIPALWAVFATILFIGISAGAVEVIVVARAYAAGSRALAGLLMACLAFGSMLAGFWYGAHVFKLSSQSLWIRCLGLLILALIPFTFAANLIILALSLFVAGLLIAPTSIAGQVLVKDILPTRLLNEGMSMIVTAMILGMAAGSWLSGILIDEFGVSYAGAFPVFAVVLAFIIALFYRTIVTFKKSRQKC